MSLIYVDLTVYFAWLTKVYYDAAIEAETVGREVLAMILFFVLTIACAVSVFRTWKKEVRTYEAWTSFVCMCGCWYGVCYTDTVAAIPDPAVRVFATVFCIVFFVGDAFFAGRVYKIVKQETEAAANRLHE